MVVNRPISIAPGDPVLLTGATGYLGKSLARELVEAGYRVTLLVRRGSRRSGIPALAVRWHEGDLLDPASYRAVLPQVRAVVHAGGLVRNWLPDASQFDRLNVDALDRLLRECKAAGVARVIYTSSFFALGPSPDDHANDETARPAGGGFNDYDRTKILGAQVVAQHVQNGLDVVSCLPTVLYGPGERTSGNHVADILQQLLERRLPGLIGSGDQVWNYVFVDDAARGHRLAMERGTAGGVYLLGGENLTLRGFLDLACELSSLPPVRRKVPLPVLMAVARAQMARARLLRIPPQLTPGMVRSYGHSWACDDARAHRELQYQGRPLREGLAITLAWLRQESGVGPSAGG